MTDRELQSSLAWLVVSFTAVPVSLVVITAFSRLFAN